MIFSMPIVITGVEQAEYTDSVFDGSVILGRPDNRSITANITSNKQSQIYLEWGESSRAYTHKSNINEASNLKPAVIEMDGLEAGREYYYRLFFKDSNTDEFRNTQEYTFRTPRSTGEEYTFVVQSDSHLSNKPDNKNKPPAHGGSKADREIYVRSMQTMAGYKPDFI